MSPQGFRVLAFDTSSSLTTVAICQVTSTSTSPLRGSLAGAVLAEEAAPSEQSHAQLLLPRVQACLERTQLALGDIDLFAVGIGPGSFTGVRVGLATAKGFALGTGKPVCGVVSLRALAAGAPGESGTPAPALIATLLDAHKGEVFAALYARDAHGVVAELLPAFNALPLLAAQTLLSAAREHAERGPLLALGSGLRRYLSECQPLVEAAAVLDAAYDVPRAPVISQLALQDYASSGPADLVTLAPLYVRGSDAQLPKSPLRV